MIMTTFSDLSLDVLDTVFSHLALSGFNNMAKACAVNRLFRDRCKDEPWFRMFNYCADNTLRVLRDAVRNDYFRFSAESSYDNRVLMVTFLGNLASFGLCARKGHADDPVVKYSISMRVGCTTNSTKPMQYQGGLSKEAFEGAFDIGGVCYKAVHDAVWALVVATEGQCCQLIFNELSARVRLNDMFASPEEKLARMDVDAYESIERFLMNAYVSGLTHKIDRVVF